MVKIQIKNKVDIEKMETKIQMSFLDYFYIPLLKILNEPEKSEDLFLKNSKIYFTTSRISNSVVKEQAKKKNTKSEAKSEATKSKAKNDVYRFSGPYGNNRSDGIQKKQADLIFVKRSEKKPEKWNNSLMIDSLIHEFKGKSKEEKNEKKKMKMNLKLNWMN